MQQGTLNAEAYEERLTIQPDTFLQSKNYVQVKTYLKNEQDFLLRKTLNPEETIQSNPSYYDTFRLVGDYYYLQGDDAKAKSYYEKALQLEIATEEERASIKKKLLRCKS
jgi:Tfp pilus assembly protein PilF